MEYRKNRRHNRKLIETKYESSSFVQVSLQIGIIEQLTAATQLPCVEVNAAKLGSQFSIREIGTTNQVFFGSLKWFAKKSYETTPLLR